MRASDLLVSTSPNPPFTLGTTADPRLDRNARSRSQRGDGATAFPPLVQHLRLPLVDRVPWWSRRPSMATQKINRTPVSDYCEEGGCSSSMRKDAQERRARLIAVAADMFEQQGYDVPLEAIAESAGIGRGTLYRNFRDRSMLVLEVVRRRLDELIAQVAFITDDRAAFRFFLVRIGLLSALHASGVRNLVDDPSLKREWHEFEVRARQLMALPLERARNAGIVRDDLSVDDISRIAQMLQAVALDLPPEERDSVMSRAVLLLMEGIAKGGSSAS
jgi:AcrR family transcriptional regulator